MAALCKVMKDGATCYRVLVTWAANDRRAVWLGEVDEEAAATTCRHIGNIEKYRKLGAPEMIPQDTVRWLDGLIGSKLYDRLAKAKLAAPRTAAKAAKPRTLGELIAKVNAEIRGSKKESTRVYYENVFSQLQEKLGGSTPVNRITAEDVDAFLTWLQSGRKRKISGPTLARRVKAYRLLFRRAVRWGFCTVNHFAEVKGGASVNHKRQHFVSREVFEAVLAATNDRQFRAVLALSRYGALRCPSEVLALKWSDVVWPDPERGTVGKIIVHSSKTEHHEGGASRTIPLFPELAAVLEAWLGEAPAGEYVISERNEKKNWRTRFTSLIERAGYAPWPKLFHNMRASRESELYRQFPLATVCKWLGHSPEVAARHYLHDGDADANFANAAVKAPIEKVSRLVSRTAGKEGENGVSETGENTAKPHENADFPSEPVMAGMGDEGLEPPTSAV